jgi:hypothetical protein
LHPKLEPKRCEVCGSPLRANNESGLCSGRSSRKCRRERARRERERRPKSASPGAKRRRKTAASGDEATRRNHNFIDRTGQRYGRLVVLKLAKIKNASGKGQSFWLCKCDCGNETIVVSYKLSSGNTKSCGCLRMQPKVPPAERARNVVLNVYRTNARKRGYRWDLTDEDFDRLTCQPCFYCGLQPSAVVTSGRGTFTYNGIDRMDNTIGYTPKNSVSCCATCNRAKRAMPYNDFIAWIVRLCRFQERLEAEWAETAAMQKQVEALRAHLHALEFHQRSYKLSRFRQEDALFEMPEAS